MGKVNMKIGDTLSQRALAVRFNLARCTVRRRGHTVRDYVHHRRITWCETWYRVEYESGRLHSYELMKIEK